MDPWTVLIGVAVCCVSAVLIYVITFISMREKTFEEVIAEQKKRQDEERERIKNDRKIEKELMKKKYKKGKGDKPKEKAPEFECPKKSEQKEPKMVNIEIEPEIIEATDSGILGSQKQKHKSGVRKRSILHNRDEIGPIIEKAVELHHKPIKPLDDLELKKLHDMKTHELEVSEMKKEKGEHTSSKQEVKELKVQKTKATDLQQGVAAEDTEPKLKNETGAKPKKATVVNGNAVKGSRLMDTLRTAELDDAEIQSLIDVLVNRQGPSADFQGSWNKKGQKGDPVSVMKKQLEEKNKALLEEQQRAASSTRQMKELRTSLMSEQEKVSAMEKQYQTRLSQQEADNEALKARLSNLHTTHMADIAKVKLQLEQLENEKSAEAASCIQLKQENKILQESLSTAIAENASRGDVSSLKQKASIMEKELSNCAMRLNASENAKKSMEEKLKKREEQIKNLEADKASSEEAVKKQMKELKEAAQQKDAQNSQLSGDLKKATSALSTVEAECAMWKTKLQELESHLSSLGDLGAKLQESGRQKGELEGSLRTMEKQLAEAVSGQKDASARLQATEDKKQEVEGNLKNLEKQLAEALQCQRDLSSELQSLHQENATLSQELKTVKEDQEKQASSAAAGGNVSAEAGARNLIDTTEHERIVSEKMAELTKVQAALDVQTQKNNELRQKNWKAMEAVENTEKLAAKKIDRALKTAREEVKQAVLDTEKMDREVLKRLFPQVHLMDSSMDHKEWLASFEKQASQLLEQSSSSEHSEKDRIRDLETENRKLQQQSETYEKNFMQLNADQERLLHVEEENQRLKNMSSTNTALSEDVSRLQAENKDLLCRLQEKEENITEAEKKLHDLECVVETEEKKWKEKLRQAEDTSAQKSESSNREQELEDLTIQQQTQIEHYRTVLTNTEQLLRQLESAEKTWEEKLTASQEELEKSRSQCQKAQQELQALRGSTEDSFFKKSVQMQGKMDDLQEELRQSSEQVDTLTKWNEQLTSKVIVLESQNKAVVQVDTEDLSKVTKELEEVKGQLDGERKRNKELSSTLVRLNGIIKTGQDALSQEQKLVKQLQDQLSDKTKGSGSSANQEIEQLRNKLSEKEKQLEREIAANKQLSQRLGQLGVLGTSAASDQGTSV